MEFAERRHQEFIQSMASMAEQNHRVEVAQLTGETVRALEQQAQGHAHATEQLRREAAFLQGDVTNYMSTQQASEHHARAVHAGMTLYNSSKDEEVRRLLTAHPN